MDFDENQKMQLTQLTDRQRKSHHFCRLV